MNNCENCTVIDCVSSGVDTCAGNCKSFELRELNEFEKSIVRHGLIVGIILGFLMGFTLIFQLYYFGVFK